MNPSLRVLGEYAVAIHLCRHNVVRAKQTAHQHYFRIRLSKIDRSPPGGPPESCCDATGGDNRDRTGDLRLAKPALSQLSYIPIKIKTPPPGNQRRRRRILRQYGGAKWS